MSHAVIRPGPRVRLYAALLAAPLVTAACGGVARDLETFFIDEEGPFLPLPPEGILTPHKVSATLAVDAVASGYHHSCALETNGRAWCWGSNEHGQLGSDAPMQRCAGDQFPCSGIPVAVGGGLTYTQIAASIRHTCAIDPSRRAWCWGSGSGGQLGDGRRENSTQPVAVADDHEFAAIAASVAGHVTCGLTPSGEAWCWGPDTDGVLGNGTRSGSATPVRVALQAPLISISVGQMHACAVTAAGNAYCWGSNWFGQLGVGSAGGDGGAGRSTTPVAVAGGIEFAAIAAGGEHTCALTADGRAYCWGASDLTGSPDTTGYVPNPVAVQGNAAYVEISTGFAHTCARQVNGQIDCWGENLGGNLGNGSTDTARAPVPIASLEPFDGVSAGGAHTCAASSAGAAWCWGGNPWGGAGDPPTDP